MIELIFYYGQEVEYVKIRGHSIWFASGSNGAVEATIDGLKLNKAGVIKEHPDLKDREDWKEEAIKRFKEVVKAMKDEEAVAEYVILELKKFGHTPKWKQIAGFRRTKIE